MWVETELGRRYKEDHGTSIAFFLTEPDENRCRKLPKETLEIIIQSQTKGDKVNV